MSLTENEFNARFTEAVEAITEAMVEAPDIDPEKFFSMVCILENLQFFSPVIYAALRQPEAGTGGESF